MRIVHVTTLPRIARLYKVAAYTRVSTAKDVAGHSLSAQVAHYTDLIGSHPDWQYAGVFSDYGVSGTKMDRPGFSALMEKARSGEVDIILVKSVSRFARNTSALISTLRELRSLGVSVRFERENIDSMTTDGELLLTLLAAFAEAESRSISENVKWSVRNRFSQGLPNSVLVYGYHWNGEDFEVVPHQADVVREVFESYLAGESPEMIGRRLGERGEVSVRGNPLGYYAVWTFLRNENYIGRTVFQKTMRNDISIGGCRKNRGELPMFRVDGLFPRIVSDEVFEMTRKEIALRAEHKRYAMKAVAPTPFSQKIICADCGHFYRRYNCSCRGVVYHYWKCGRKIDDGKVACSSPNINESVLETVAKDVVGLDVLDIPSFDSLVDHMTIYRGGQIDFHMNDGSVRHARWRKVKGNV